MKYGNKGVREGVAFVRGWGWSICGPFLSPHPQGCSSVPDVVLITIKLYDIQQPFCFDLCFRRRSEATKQLYVNYIKMLRKLIFKIKAFVVKY